LPGRGQAHAAADAEAIRLADVEPLLEERDGAVAQGVPWAAECAGPLVDRRVFRGGLATGPGGGADGMDVGVASAAWDDGSHGVDRELEVLGELVSGEAFVEVSTADLVV
jgi:hypothetical protein